MKKFLLTFLWMSLALTVQAEDYPYLTFETIGGQKISVSCSGLSLSVSGTTLTAGSETFELVNLSKMYFTADNETTGINEINLDQDEEVQAIYDLQGRKLSDAQNAHGAVIVKTNKGTFKIFKK